MRLPWQTKDYLFAFCMTIAMVVAGLIVPKIVPAQLEIIGWAPFGAFFLTLGMVRLRHRGSILLMLLPCLPDRSPV